MMCVFIGWDMMNGLLTVNHQELLSGGHHGSQLEGGLGESNCIPSSGIFGEVTTVLDVLGLLTVLSEAVCCPR
jgi:hypothetical protein